jgi:hypothetical protein
LKEQETIDAVAQLGEGTLGQIVQALGQNKGSVHRRLQNLCGRGALAARQTPKGVTYRLAAVETVETVEAVEVVEAVETVEVVEAVETVEVVEVVEVVGAVEALAQAQDCDYNEGAYPLPASPDAARPPARWCGERPAPTTVRKVTV